MDWKRNFEEGRELIISTCSKLGNPNANIVISLGFVGEKLMVADVSMKQTIKNLRENPKICVIGGYIRLLGKVNIFTSGEYFESATRRVVTQDKNLVVKGVILISIEEIFDLENVRKIK